MMIIRFFIQQISIKSPCETRLQYGSYTTRCINPSWAVLCVSYKMNFFKAIILPLTLILVACGTIPAQVPTENLASFASPHPSLTFTPKPSLTKTPTLTTTPTSTLAPIAPIPTLPALLTPEPALIQDFTGIYFLSTRQDNNCESPCVCTK